MKRSLLFGCCSFAFLIAFLVLGCKPKQSDVDDSELKKSLKVALDSKFYIGTAMNEDQIKGKDSASIALILKHFNTITAENCMKSAEIHPEEGVYSFALSDDFVKFGMDNKMFIVGHTLIWHSQAPDWFFIDKNGKDVSKDVLIERMKNHISFILKRYKGKVNGWDVVNEAFEDDGSWRKSKFYEIIGEDYIKLAFQFAHEADPDAELYYNDFNLVRSAKREAVINQIRKLKAEGIKVDAVGEQGHYGFDFPTLNEFEQTIVDFEKIGVKVMITEFDISVLPFPDENMGADIAKKAEYSEIMNPYQNGLPDSVSNAFTNRYFDLMKILLKHKDVVTRVTFWGVNDAQSWRNYWPIRGRMDYPLLFDRQNNPKPIVDSIINFCKLQINK